MPTIKYGHFSVKPTVRLFYVEESFPKKSKQINRPIGCILQKQIPLEYLFKQQRPVQW